MPKAPKLTVEMVPTSDLIPYINNAKLHPEEHVNQIAASIQEFGFNDPIAIDGENGIIEGHGRLLAALKLKMGKVPVIRLDHLTPAQKKAYTLAHNKLTMVTGFDADLLKLEMEALAEEGFDLGLTGFQEEEIQALIDDLETDPAPKERKTRTITYQSRMEVVVECETEQEQQQAFELLTKEGYKCRVLTL